MAHHNWYAITLPNINRFSTRKPSGRKGKRATAVRVSRPLAKKSTAKKLSKSTI